MIDKRFCTICCKFKEVKFVKWNGIELECGHFNSYSTLDSLDLNKKEK